MNKRFTYRKILVAAMFVLAVNLVFGAFSGKVDDHKNKFSLKNLSAPSHVYSFNSLTTNSFRYSGSSGLLQQNNGNNVQIQSMIRLERGNTTYIYPYKYTVKVPKFKTPTAPIR